MVSILTEESLQSTLNHQSQVARSSWNRVPFGQRKVKKAWGEEPTQTWNIWHRTSGPPSAKYSRNDDDEVGEAENIYLRYFCVDKRSQWSEITDRGLLLIELDNLLQALLAPRPSAGPTRTSGPQNQTSEPYWWKDQIYKKIFWK